VEFAQSPGSWHARAVRSVRSSLGLLLVATVAMWLVLDRGRPERTPVGPEARFAKRIEGASGVTYAAEVSPTLLRGGMPSAEGIAWLKARGVRTIVSLRHYHGVRESRAVRAAGLRYEGIRLESTDAPEPEQVERFMAIVTDPAAQPVYLHCLHGVDRTGAMVALYRMEIEGWTASDALAEMQHFGPHAILHDLRRWVGGYTATGRWRKVAPVPAIAP
jgi:tyrosine-protein phosphatase SIW14